MFRNLSIGTRLFTMAGVTSLILVIVGWIAIRALQSSATTLDQSLASSVRITAMIDNARDTQGELVKQWKEWKDLLIRGHKKEDFEKYYANFQKQDSVVDTQLAEVKDSIAALGFGDLKVAALLDEHHALSER